MFRVMDSEDSEAREDSSSEGSHPSTDLSDDSVEVRVGGVTRPPKCNPSPAPYPPNGVYPHSKEGYTSSLLNSSYRAANKVPPKFRKSYNSLDPITHILAQSQASQAIAFAAATKPDHVPNGTSRTKAQEDIPAHSRRRKPAEPRKLYSENSKKRSHSPSPEPQVDSHATKFEQLECKSPKRFKVTTPEPSPPMTTPPLNTLPTNPLFQPSILSPLVSHPALSPPNISPTRGPNLPPHLLPPGWPSNLPYHQYNSFLRSMLPNPLALLQSGLGVPPYSLMPLLQNLSKPSDNSLNVVPSPPKTRSPTPSIIPAASTSLKDNSPSPPSLISANKSSDKKLDGGSEEKPMALVKREDETLRRAFDIASLVSKSNSLSSNLKPPSQPLNKFKKLTSAPPISAPPSHDHSIFSKIKHEIGSPPMDRKFTERKLPALPPHLSDLGASCSSQPSTSTSSEQQLALRQKQRNYKNMTRERRIEANARERTRVHTISSAYEKLRQAVPAYSHTQKLSKLSILRIASSYILTLSKLADDSPETEISDCVEETTKTIQFEGKAKKKREE